MFDTRKGCSFVSVILTVVLLVTSILLRENIVQEITSQPSVGRRRLQADPTHGKPQTIRYAWDEISVKYQPAPAPSQGPSQLEPKHLGEDPMATDLNQVTYSELLSQNLCGVYCNSVSNLKTAGLFTVALTSGAIVCQFITFLCLCVYFSNTFRVVMIQRLSGMNHSFYGNRRVAILFCFLSWCMSLGAASAYLLLLNTEAGNLQKFVNDVYADTYGHNTNFSMPGPGVSLFCSFGGCLMNGIGLVSICCFSDRSRSRFDSLDQYWREGGGAPLLYEPNTSKQAGGARFNATWDQSRPPKLKPVVGRHKPSLGVRDVPERLDSLDSCRPPKAGSGD